MTKKSKITKAEITRIVSGIIAGGLDPKEVTVRADGSVHVFIKGMASEEVTDGSGWDDV